MKESGEMYLETILVLSKQKSNVRAIDVAENLGYTKPSISRALSKLKQEDYITVDEKGYISFKEKGRRIAEKIYERHELLSELLTDIGVDKQTAQNDACKIEHVISDTTFNAIKEHIKNRKN